MRARWLIAALAGGILALGLTGCSTTTPASIDGWYLRGDTTLVLRVMGGPDAANVRVSVTETPTTVTARATYTETRTGPHTLLGYLHDVPVTLKAPLGDRTVDAGEGGRGAPPPGRLTLPPELYGGPCTGPPAGGDVCTSSFSVTEVTEGGTPVALDPFTIQFLTGAETVTVRILAACGEASLVAAVAGNWLDFAGTPTPSVPPGCTAVQTVATWLRSPDETTGRTLAIFATSPDGLVMIVSNKSLTLRPVPA